MPSKKKVLEILKSVGSGAIGLGLLALFIYTWRVSWVWFVLVGTAWALWSLYRYKENFMIALRGAEHKIFGKPLDKEYWVDDKPKMPKFVWRKKK